MDNTDKSGNQHKRKRKRISRNSPAKDVKYVKVQPGQKTAGYDKNKQRKGRKRNEKNVPTGKTMVESDVFAKGDGKVRLNKYISHSGICSRREADQLIEAGAISVNDELVTELGKKIERGDVVKYNGEIIRSEKKVYILLNKPKDVVTTTDDPENRKTVIDLIRKAGSERVYPVGRLDRNTTGVILLTNDGEMATRLAHPKHEVKKIYHIFLDKNFKMNDFEQLVNGIELEDGFIKPDAVSFINSEKKNELGLEIHSGKNRIVRRIFEKLGYHVNRLDRVYFAGLTKKNLPRGRWRYLNIKEINRLKMNAS